MTPAYTLVLVLLFIGIAVALYMLAPTSGQPTIIYSPGHTWATPAFAMQDFPVSNMHAHAQPILAYLRLLGVCPDETGHLSPQRAKAAMAGRFNSHTFHVGPIWPLVRRRCAVRMTGPCSNQTRKGE